MYKSLRHLIPAMEGEMDDRWLLEISRRERQGRSANTEKKQNPLLLGYRVHSFAPE
jgi:hypothetical protein